MQSLLVSQWEDVQLGADLATALLTPTYLKQVNWSSIVSRHGEAMSCSTNTEAKWFKLGANERKLIMLNSISMKRKMLDFQKITVL